MTREWRYVCFEVLTSQNCPPKHRTPSQGQHLKTSDSCCWSSCLVTQPSREKLVTVLFMQVSHTRMPEDIFCDIALFPGCSYCCCLFVEVVSHIQRSTECSKWTSAFLTAPRRSDEYAFLLPIDERQLQRSGGGKYRKHVSSWFSMLVFEQSVTAEWKRSVSAKVQPSKLSLARTNYGQIDFQRSERDASRADSPSTVPACLFSNICKCLMTYSKAPQFISFLASGGVPQCHH